MNKSIALWFNSMGCGGILFFIAGQVWAADLQATLQWHRRVELSTPVSGVVVEVLVETGNKVTKGNALLKLDSHVRQARLEQAKAELEQQEKLRAEAKKELDRAQELYDRTVLSNHELEVAKIDDASANAKYFAARAAVAQYESDLNYSVVRAPFDGVVVNRFAEVGQTVINELKPMVLFIFAETGKMIARTEIAPGKLSTLKTGQAIAVKVAGKRFHGKIMYLGLEPASGLGEDARYTLEVEFEPGDSILRAGQLATLVLP